MRTEEAGRREATGAERKAEGARGVGLEGLALGGPRPLTIGCSFDANAAAIRDRRSIRTSRAWHSALETASARLEPPFIERVERGAPSRCTT